MSIGAILLIVLLLFIVFGAWPGYGVGHDYGYYPSGIGTVLIIILILWLFGVFR